MNKKFTKLIAALALLVFMTPTMAGWGQTRTETETTYTWTSASWADATSSWNSNKAGQSYQSSIGGGCVQVTSSDTYSGAGATSKNSFSNITKISVNAGTTKKGVGNITVKVGNGTAQTICSISATDQSFADYELTFNPAVSGTVTFVVNCSTNSMYMHSISVTTSDTYTVTYDGNGSDSGTVPVDNNEYDEGDVVTVLGPGTMAKTGHTFEWWEDTEGTPYEEDDTFEIYENTTLTAQWSVNTYNYTLNVTGDDNNALAQLYVDNAAVLTGAKIAYGKEVTVAVTVSEGYTYTIGVKDASNNDVLVSNDKFTMPASNVTVTVTTAAIPTYTITFDAGTGTAVSPITGFEGSTITLLPTTPSAACVSRGWTFAGWATANVSETNTAPALLNGQYTVTGNATLYAVYKVTEGDGGTTTFNFETIASENGWTDASQHTTVEISPVTITANGGGNNGKYYESDKTWRMYNGGSVSITASGNNITSVSSNPSTTFTVSNGSASQSFSATTKFKSIEVTYGSSTTTYNSNPSCLEIVATPTFTVAAGTYTGAQTVEINCETTGASIYYTLDGSEPNNQSTPYNGAISIATSTTLKAIATNDGMDDSEIATAEYVIQYILTVSKDHVGFGLYDYYVDEDEQEHWDDIDVNEQTGTALVRSGANVRISVEDVDDCYLLQGFNVVDGDNNPVQVDNLMEEDGTYSFIMPASNATLTASVNQATEYTLTVAGLNNVTYTDILAGVGSEEVTLTNNQATLCEGINVDIVGLTANAGLLLQSVTLNDGTTTTTLELEYGVYHFTMPSSNATLTFTTHEAETFTYTKVNSVTPGKHYIIVSVASSNKYYAMGGKNANGSYMNPIEVSVDDNTVTVAENEGVAEILIGGTIDNYTLHTSEGYLAGGEKMLDINGTVESTWGISFDGDQAVITWSNTNYAIQYNPSNPRFACYSSSQTKVCLYEKNEYDLTINGYGNSTTGGWYLIASPVTELTPSDDNGFLTDSYGSNIPDGETGTYDLYYFDQTGGDNGKEWKNYRQHTFNLESGKGYLYASKEGTDLIFTGTAYNGNGVVNLTYSESQSIDDNMRGWNLIGNPFGTAATLDLPYYQMNDSRTALGAKVEGGEIAAMEGVFVYAYNQTASQTIATATFTPAGRSANTSQGIVNLNVENNGSVIDNAIVRFDEGRTLPKFYFGNADANLYILQGEKEYAIATSEAQGELPLNFRANEDGQYTLTVNPEGVEMNYLHLIDNMTGNDIDLLQTPSYTFNATTRDYESRFRLVFAANNEDGVSTSSTTFAFYSNGNWMVNNEGEATLQIIDVMGRVLSNQTISGTAELSLNQQPGVYVLRLVNGNDVKTQTIVVR